MRYKYFAQEANIFFLESEKKTQEWLRAVFFQLEEWQPWELFYKFFNVENVSIYNNRFNELSSKLKDLLLVFVDLFCFQNIKVVNFYQSISKTSQNC